MAIVGTIKGFSSGLLIENFTTVVVEDINTTSALFKAVVATAFAYEGWIVATSINSELKDAKKNLPKALIIGTIAVVVIYIIYYIGLAGGVTNKEMMEGGEAAAKLAFSAVLSNNVAGTLMFVFVVISCLGTLNGLMLGCTRGLYSCAMRDLGPSPKFFRQVDEESNMPSNSAIFGLFISAAWLLYFYGSVVTTIEGNKPWFGSFSFDSSELPIVTIYAMYIPIFIAMIKKEKGLSVIKGKIAPIIAILGSLFMIFAAVYAHGYAPYIDAKAAGTFSAPIVFYLIVYVCVMAIGISYLFKKKKN